MRVRNLIWLAVPLLLFGAAMLLADIGAAGLWIAVIAVGLALVGVGGLARHAPAP